MKVEATRRMVKRWENGQKVPVVIIGRSINSGQRTFCNSRCRSCHHLTNEIVPIAYPERENHSDITSEVCSELLSRGLSIYGFSSNGWSATRESSFGFSTRSASRPKTFTHVSRHSSEKILTASGASAGGASMFGKDVKTCVTRYDLAGWQLIFLTSTFWNCWTNNPFTRLIRFPKPRVFPTQLS
jgi:hypothetical protein